MVRCGSRTLRQRVESSRRTDSTLGSERHGVPKYLNPPRTAVYDKSTALYTPNRAQLAEDGQVVIGRASCRERVCLGV